MPSFNIHVPLDVKFKVRVQIDTAPGFEWGELESEDIFRTKKVAVFSLPGAWTPTCTSTHLPMFESSYDRLKQLGIDEVYCMSVNDSFTMNAWFSHLGIKNVKPLPDGNAEFTRKMGFLVDKSNLGFGYRSWRYSMIVNDGVVDMLWVEPGLRDQSDTDPFEVSDVGTMLEYLEKNAS
jgi:peroxiredoxin